MESQKPLNSVSKLGYYQHCFTKLNRDSKKGGAPHKPVLLLALIQAYSRKLIIGNKVFITPELVSLFKDYWGVFVETDHEMRFSLPFFHMKGEPFWRLVPKTGCEVWIENPGSMRSFTNLEKAVEYAEIDSELSELLSDESTLIILKQTVIGTYFPQKKEVFSVKSYIDVLGDDILWENAEEYILKIKVLQKELSTEDYQQEIYLRGGAFKREIPKHYNYSCCITGMRVDSIANISMIDACHIVPFSESYNDTINNGIALCPNLHRAFDRGLISVDDDYRVLVSDVFKEAESIYSLRTFAGKQIILPANSVHYPKDQNFGWHRANVFRG